MKTHKREYLAAAGISPRMEPALHRGRKPRQVNKQNRPRWCRGRPYSEFCHQNALHTASAGDSFPVARLHFFTRFAPHAAQYHLDAHTTHASMTHRSLWQFWFSLCPYALRCGNLWHHLSHRIDPRLERMGKKSASPIAPHRHHLLSAPM